MPVCPQRPHSAQEHPALLSPATHTAPDTTHTTSPAAPRPTARLLGNVRAWLTSKEEQTRREIQAVPLLPDTA